jgi:hypothetical protein
MDVADYVFVINGDDEFYGHKFIIRAVQTDFSGKITGYTVNGHSGRYRDYPTTDLQYTTRRRKTFTSQMQLF